MSDIAAKARRAAEWFNATQDKTLDSYESADPNLEEPGWDIFTCYRYGGTLHDSACRYDGLSDRMLIAFCEDRGWQDQDQEADGVEWRVTEERADLHPYTLEMWEEGKAWRWTVSKDLLTAKMGTAPTRSEARRQAVEAARGMG